MTALLMVLALTADPAMDMPTLNALTEIRQCIEASQKLEQHGVVIDKSIAINLLKEAEQVSGGIVKTYDDLLKVTGKDTPPPTVIEKAEGMLTFVNIVWVSAAILGIAAIVWLFGLYFLALIMIVPKEAWLVICTILCGALIFGGLKVESPYGLSMALPGCLGLIGCLALFHHIVFDDEEILSPYAWFLAIVWAGVALLYGSHVIGFFAVMALLTALGFIMGMIPGVIYMGFNEDEYIPRTTFAAGLITLFWVLLRITGTTDPRLDVFREGMMVCGTFVYFIGMLIWSSKWCCMDRSYHSVNLLKYLTLQIVMVVSGVLAVYLGSVYQIGFLLGIGGTVFYIYLLEKYYEIPWKGAGWAWSTLGLAGILYAFATFAKANPTYFMFWQ